MFLPTFPHLLDRPKHVAEERTLFNRIIQCNVSMRNGIKPLPWHVSLPDLAILPAEDRHCKGLHVQHGMRKGAFACEPHQIPVDEQEVIGCRVGHENRLSRKILGRRSHRMVLPVFGPRAKRDGVSGRLVAPGSVSRLAWKVRSKVLSVRYTADPKLNIE